MARVDIDFQHKTATVTTKPGKTVNREAAEQALKAAGYGLTSFSERDAGRATGT